MAKICQSSHPGCQTRSARRLKIGTHVLYNVIKVILKNKSGLEISFFLINFLSTQKKSEKMGIFEHVFSGRGGWKISNVCTLKGSWGSLEHVVSFRFPKFHLEIYIYSDTAKSPFPPLPKFQVTPTAEPDNFSKNHSEYNLKLVSQTYSQNFSDLLSIV